MLKTIEIHGVVYYQEDYSIPSLSLIKYDLINLEKIINERVLSLTQNQKLTINIEQVEGNKYEVNSFTDLRDDVFKSKLIFMMLNKDNSENKIHLQFFSKETFVSLRTKQKDTLLGIKNELDVLFKDKQNKYPKFSNNLSISLEKKENTVFSFLSQDDFKIQFIIGIINFILGFLLGKL